MIACQPIANKTANIITNIEIGKVSRNVIKTQEAKLINREGALRQSHIRLQNINTVNPGETFQHSDLTLMSNYRLDNGCRR